MPAPGLVTERLAAMVADRMQRMDDDEWRYRAALAATAHDVVGDHPGAVGVRVDGAWVIAEWPPGEPLLRVPRHELLAMPPAVGGDG